MAGPDSGGPSNPALSAATQGGAVLPVFILDAARAQGAASRWRPGRALQALDAARRRRERIQDQNPASVPEALAMPPELGVDRALRPAEVVRGGLVKSSGEPSAALNLVRKRAMARQPAAMSRPHRLLVEAGR